ncbi:hypothetical protein IFM89_021669 [Coptis chinensis]|uniref:F-box associated beta-propeller type 3 domain-containing protein n=1 Tax=Coptis chinensis TaxID=261450 RepID=A0A835M0H3_9MAGN|nr:hypothetical protein IFM89_021669 [Coptis chinensis]
MPTFIGKKQKRVKKSKCVAWWKLPQDITFDILSRLPVETLIQCRRPLIFKEWRTTISDPLFVHAQFVRASQANDQNHDILVVTSKWELCMVNHVGCINESVKRLPFPNYLSKLGMNSCNGLLCLWDYPFNRITIYNPFITNDIMKLPYDRSRTSSGCGFGFDPIKNQYKVVAFFRSSTGLDAEVYTLGLGSWRIIGEVPFNPLQPENENVFLNGTLYWLAKRRAGRRNGIGYFDFGREKFQFDPTLPFNAVSGKIA